MLLYIVALLHTTSIKFWCLNRLLFFTKYYQQHFSQHRRQAKCTAVQLQIVELSHNHATWLLAGPSPAGGPLVPGPPFEIGAPHLTFGPPVAAYIQYCMSKLWPPLLVFGPSFWFLAPPAAKSWRRAWLLVDTKSKIPLLKSPKQN